MLLLDEPVAALSRYWEFQSIETVIFLALAVGLVAVAFAVVRRHDA